MGTKADPKPNDCYSKALPDEPQFTLLARDPTAPAVVSFWATHRQAMIGKGDAPASDSALIEEAIECGKAMRDWRRDNDGKWRKLRVERPTFSEARDLLAGGLQQIVPATAEAIGEGRELTPLEHNAVEALALLLDAAYDGRNGSHDMLTHRPKLRSV